MCIFEKLIFERFIVVIRGCFITTKLGGVTSILL